MLHDAFAFFSGIRFVPIVTALTLSLVGLFIPLLWEYVAMGIAGIGHIIQSTSVFGPFLYGVGVLLLKPFGLHHILLAMVRFTPAGGIEMVNGREVAGALNIFYAELKAGLPFSPHVTAFLSQGFMPTFIFGLPAVAYAIYRTARPENRPVIKGLLLSGVLVSVVTGISEPIEFLFLFIAPVLYAFHIVMSGPALMVMALLGVTIGNTDGGILDLLIFGVMQGMSTKWYLLFPVGMARLLSTSSSSAGTSSGTILKRRAVRLTRRVRSVRWKPIPGHVENQNTIMGLFFARLAVKRILSRSTTASPAYVWW